MALPAWPLRKRRRQIGFAIETTETLAGTAATVSAAANLLVYDPVYSAADPTASNRRKQVGQYAGESIAPTGGKQATITFTSEPMYNDDTGSLLTACGMVNATGTYTHTMNASTFKCATIYMTQDGRKVGIKNAMGSYTIMFDNGGRLMIQWTFVGIPLTVADASMWSATPVSSNASFRASDMTITWASAAVPKFSTGRVICNNNCFVRPDAAKSDGYSHAMMGDPDLSASFDFDAALVANFDAFGNRSSATAGALSVAFSDGTHTITITSAKAQFADISDGSRDTITTDETTFRLVQSTTGDDALKVIFA